MSTTNLGLINKQLSEENLRLQNMNENLELSNQILKLKLDELDNGKNIPISQIDSIKQIAALNTKIKVLKRKLSKYESITEKYENEKSSITDYIINSINNKMKHTKKKERKLESDINDCSYKPQSTVETDSALVRKKSKMRVDNVLEIILEYMVNGNRSVTKRDIIDNTGLSDSQVSNALNKFSDKFYVMADPNNRRRNIFNLK